MELTKKQKLHRNLEAFEFTLMLTLASLIFSVLGAIFGSMGLIIFAVFLSLINLPIKALYFIVIAVRRLADSLERSEQEVSEKADDFFKKWERER